MTSQFGSQICSALGQPLAAAVLCGVCRSRWPESRVVPQWTETQTNWWTQIPNWKKTCSWDEGLPKVNTHRTFWSKFLILWSNYKKEEKDLPTDRKDHGLIHTGRATRREANGTCVREWECSHCMQATSKGLHSNLLACVLCEWGLSKDKGRIRCLTETPSPPLLEEEAKRYLLETHVSVFLVWVKSLVPRKNSPSSSVHFMQPWMAHWRARHVSE